MRHRITAFLIWVLLCVWVSAQADQIYTFHPSFKAINQSPWGPSSDTFTYDAFFGPTWDWSGSIGDVNLDDCDWGLGAKASTSGKIGLSLNAYANGGYARVDYPIKVVLICPEVAPNASSFTISSLWGEDHSAYLQTTAPSAGMQADGVLQAACRAEIMASADFWYIFGDWCPTADFHPINLNLDWNKTFFDTEALLAGADSRDFSLFGGLLTGNVHRPDVNTFGGYHSDGGTGLLASDSQRVFSAQFDLTNLLASALGLPSPNPEFSIDILDGVMSLSASGHLLDLTANLSVDLQQTFHFQPKPRITLHLSTGSSVSFDAGESVIVSMPAVGNLTITPTVSLPNTFQNQTSLLVDPSLYFNPFEFSLSASAFGWDDSFDWQPIAPIVWSAPVTVPLTDRTFPLDFDPIDGDAFQVVGSGLIAVSPIVYQPPLSLAHYFPQALTPNTVQNFLTGATRVTLTGRNFDPSSRAYLTRFGVTEAVPTTLVNAQTLNVSIPNKYRLLAGTSHLWVKNRNTEASNNVDVTVNTPVPQIAALASGPDAQHGPTNQQAQFTPNPYTSQDLYLYVNVNAPSFPATELAALSNLAGNLFSGANNDALYPGAKAFWDDQALATAPFQLGPSSPSGSIGGLVVSRIPAALLERGGVHQITLANPGPGGGTSNTLTFTVNNPFPTLTAVSPAQFPVGGSFKNRVLNVYGSGFNRASVVMWNNTIRRTHYISPTHLVADILPPDFVSTGLVVIAVSNPAPGGGISGTQTVSLVNPLPAIQRVSKSSAYAGSSALHITLTGQGFNASSRVCWNGQPRATTCVSDNVLIALITASDLAQPGTARLTVSNPAPGGGLSNALAFTILQGASVSGKITLEECQNPAQTIGFIFQPTQGGDSILVSLKLNNQGGFRINGIPPKQYTVHIKGDKWLRQAIRVNTRVGEVTTLNGELRGGDANNDNSVDILDLDILLQAFDSDSNASYWNENADFNCDGSVDVLDLDLLMNNFDQVGDE